MGLETIFRQFPSNAETARRLHRQWKAVDKAGAADVRVESLATKIGELRRGKADWWVRRRALCDLLADMLGCTALELLGRPAAPPGSLHFPEFPALPPLRPDEDAPRIVRGGWLLDRVRAADPGGVHLIVAGPGMGKSFVVRWLTAHAESEFAAISTLTLAGVGALMNDPRILVIDIDERDPRTDADVLRALGERTHQTIVLSPFELPGVGIEKNPPSFNARARTSFLQWISDRLERSERDTRLDLEEVRAWLQAHDPEVELVASPADLLAFCADVDAAGLDEATWEVRARRWLRSTVRLFGPDAPTAVPPAEDLVDALCTATLTRREHPWGPLPGGAWPGLVPDDLRGADNSRWGRVAVVHGLRDAGLLRGAKDGLRLTPTWVHHGLAAAALERLLASEDVDAWGLLAVDASRQHLVDEALDHRTNTDFRATVRAVARPREARTLGLLGAREAVFSAAARRLLREDFEVPPADVPAWHALAEHQIASLKHEPQAWYPRTRPDWDGAESFWADAWTLSLGVPAPSCFDHPTLAWHFPGWVAELPPLTDEPHWPSSAVQPWGARDGVQRIAQLAPLVLTRLPALPEHHRCPRVLLPAVVLLAPQRGWTLTPQLLDGLPGSWEGHYLAKVLEQRPPDERTTIADMLWDVLPFLLSADRQVPVALRLMRLANSARELLPFIVAHISEAALVRTIEQDGLYKHEDQVEPLLQLSRPLRRVIVRKALAASPGSRPDWYVARSIARLLDSEDVDLLRELIRGSDKLVAAEFTGLVWKLAPASALEEVLAAISDQRPTAQAWCWYAPRDHLATLAEALQSGPRPDWVAEWAASRLPDAGLAAEALFELAEL